jgi:hypothetical protein
VKRLSPVVVAVLVTALFIAYGRHPWSWVAGPVAGVLVWAFDRKAHDPAEPRRSPAPVD